MRRRRLLADSADPDHAEVDPNDVAEYLDNVLTPSRIADLEKRLLEHDSDLAEVASVHQILSLVLGKPSDVPIRAKERAYKLVRAKGRSHLELDPIGPTRGGNSGIMADPGPLSGPSSTSEGAPSFSIGMGALVALLVGLLGITLYFVIAGQKDRPMPPVAQRVTSDSAASAKEGGEANSPVARIPRRQHPPLIRLSPRKVGQPTRSSPRRRPVTLPCHHQRVMLPISLRYQRRLSRGESRLARCCRRTSSIRFREWTRTRWPSPRMNRHRSPSQRRRLTPKRSR